MLAVLAGDFEGLEEGHAGLRLESHQGAELNEVAALGAAPPFEPFDARFCDFGFRRIGFFRLGLQQPEAGGFELFLQRRFIMSNHETGDGAATVINTTIAEDRHNINSPVVLWSCSHSALTAASAV